MKWDKVSVQTGDGLVSGIAPVIISASRATDIPAFYGEWFAGRLAAGYLARTNPFNSAAAAGHLLREDPGRRVLEQEPGADRALSRPARRAGDQLLLHVHGQRLRAGRPREVGPAPRTRGWRHSGGFRSASGASASSGASIRSSSAGRSPRSGSSRRSGASATSCIAHAQAGHQLCRHLPVPQRPGESEAIGAGRVRGTRPGGGAADRARDSKPQQELGARVASCAEKVDLSAFDIAHNRCIDDELMARAFPHDAELMAFLGRGGGSAASLFGGGARAANPLKDSSQRESCGCIASKDIGRYDTCPHHCAYCYANSSFAQADDACRRHTPGSEQLEPDGSGFDARPVRPYDAGRRRDPEHRPPEGGDHKAGTT